MDRVRQGQDVPLDLGRQIGQPQESRELAGVDVDLPGQGLLREAGLCRQPGLEIVGLLEYRLDSRRLGLAGALSENCQAGLIGRWTDDFLPALGRENYPELGVVPQNKRTFQFSPVFAQRR